MTFRKLKVEILFNSLFILTLSISLIIGYTYYQNTLTVSENARQYLKNSANHLKEHIYTAMLDGQKLVQTHAPLLDLEAIDQMEKSPLSSNLLTSFKVALDQNPHISSVLLGTRSKMIEIFSAKGFEDRAKAQDMDVPENTQVVVKVVHHDSDVEMTADEPSRDKERTAKRKTSNKEKETLQKEDTQESEIKEVHEEWHFVSLDSQLSKYHQGNKIKFNIQKKDWYARSKERHDLQWTTPFIIMNGVRGEIGIGTFQALINRKGTFQGALMAQLTMQTFSEMLQKYQLSKNSLAFVMNEQQQVLSISDSAYSALSLSDAKKELSSLVQAQYTIEKVQDFKSPLLDQSLALFEKTKWKEDILQMKLGGEDYLISFIDFASAYSDFPRKWKLVVMCPLKDFVADIQKSRNKILICSVCILLFAFLLAFRLAKRLSIPIMVLAKEAQKIKDLDLGGEIDLHSNIQEIDDLTKSIQSLKTTMASFSYYIPKKLVEKLLNRKQPIHVGGRLKEISLMFTDIVGFTSISESLPADKTALYLSEYFEELTAIIMENNGTVDKYIGDAIMAFWGSPVPDRNHVFHACRSALLCQKRLSELNQIWKREERPVLNTRIGIHLGEAIVGNIGSSERMNYTVIGDNVNLGARLEGLNKFYGTNIIASETVYDQLKGTFLFRSLDMVAVKGKEKPIKIFEVVGQLKGDNALYPSDDQVAFCAQFEQAYHLFLTRQWKEAIEAFQSLSESHPYDLSVESYLKRSKEYLKTPPPKEWDGTLIMQSK